MTGFREFDSQFRETQYEREARQRETRRKRTVAGRCWQCAKPIATCTCPNITHPKGAT